ncbi:histidine-phosphotransfer domain, HPT domain-containing protein [Mycena alexandri]|uniref:Histidine-phosphotransfer domain, HPT domain-containing protein n=1 Tax=Mycena alexandri TaxID=1745969 RepID=A0AAD6XBK2_9AGAR|nr:histidine-phosphotransfer domain, HPT domain-containing protein [Mycena alexandri]
MADDPPPRTRTSPPPADPAPKPPASKDPNPETPRSPPPPADSESVPDPPAKSEARHRLIWHRQAIDMDIFSQILELDEDGTYDFSKEMVVAYFSQATTTFSDMDKAIARRADEKLPELSALGHFLKGSSAALGISKVQATCEKMQHYGALRDEAADKDLKADEALSKISALLVEVKAEYADAERWLKKWYEDKNESFEGVKP